MFFFVRYWRVWNQYLRSAVYEFSWEFQLQLLRRISAGERHSVRQRRLVLMTTGGAGCVRWSYLLHVQNSSNCRQIWTKWSRSIASVKSEKRLNWWAPNVQGGAPSCSGYNCDGTVVDCRSSSSVARELHDSRTVARKSCDGLNAVASTTLNRSSRSCQIWHDTCRDLVTRYAL